MEFFQAFQDLHNMLGIFGHAPQVDKDIIYVDKHKSHHLSWTEHDEITCPPAPQYRQIWISLLCRSTEHSEGNPQSPGMGQRCS